VKNVFSKGLYLRKYVLKKKIKEKNCKDLGVDQYFMKFAKIPMLDSLIFFYIFLTKKDMGILRILTGFNG